MLANRRIGTGRVLAGIVLGLSLLVGPACDSCSSADECGAGTCCVNRECIDDCGPDGETPNIKVKAGDESSAERPMNLHEIVQILFPPMH